MVQEDKNLLLRYLCAALPYEVIIEYNNDSCVETREMGLGSLHDFMFGNAEIKPYLRPMSSMTEEETDAYWDSINLKCPKFEHYTVFWLLENHFDFMGLISKGLAIEVTEESNPY